MVKKISSGLITILLPSLILVPTLTYAIPLHVQPPTADEIGVQRSPINTADEITNLVINATRGWYTSFFIFAVLFILIAAFKYLTASGDPEKIKTSHKMLIWAIVAIAIAIIAVGAEAIVRSFLSGGN